MIMRVLSFSRFAALMLFGLAFGAAPAAAQCGGCYAPAPIVVGAGLLRPAPAARCGSAYYGYYAAAGAYPYYSGYAYADVEVDVYTPRLYGRGYGRYLGARRGLRPLLITPRRLRVKVQSLNDGSLVMPASRHSFCCYACSISTSVPQKSLGCRNSTGLPWAPIFGSPSPSTRAPCALSLSRAARMSSTS